MSIADKKRDGLAGSMNKAAGRSSVVMKPETPAMDKSAGLDFAPLATKPLDWFKENKENHVFDAMKTEAYFDNLRRDIEEAGALLNPCVALSDGTLIEGHSRIRVIRELKEEGKWSTDRVPVRIVVSEISDDEIKKRVYLGNLSRFEIDEDTRLSMYTTIWPDFFTQKGKAGKPSKSDPRGPITYIANRTEATEAQSDPGGPIAKENDSEAASVLLTIADIAKRTGLSEGGIKKKRRVSVRATEIANADGRELPSKDDIASAKAEALETRREQERQALAEKNRQVQEEVALRLKTENRDTEVVETLLKGFIGKSGKSFRVGVQQTLLAMHTAKFLTDAEYQKLKAVSDGTDTAGEED